MPMRALLVIGFSTLLASGCAHWPSAEHRAVTLDSIETLLNAQGKTNKNNSSKSSVRCLDGDSIERQSAQLEQINKQLTALMAANPTFSASACTQTTESAVDYEGRMIVGAVEWVYLELPKHHYMARVDSGAATSSLHAYNITRFERNGKRWVRFVLKNGDDQEIEVETPLVRIASIRQASSEELDRRPVVSMKVYLGNVQQETEFTLTDRSDMTYPVLLGREFLRDITLIDVGRQHVQPKYQPAPEPVLPEQKAIETPISGDKDDSFKPKSTPDISSEKSTPVIKEPKPAVNPLPANKPEPNTVDLKPSNTSSGNQSQNDKSDAPAVSAPNASKVE